MDERALTERLITYDTSTLEGMQSAAGFVKGWLEARDVEVTGTTHNGRPVLAATRRPADRARRSSCTATSTSCRRAPSSSPRASRATASTAAAPTT